MHSFPLDGLQLCAISSHLSHCLRVLFSACCQWILLVFGSEKMCFPLLLLQTRITRVWFRMHSWKFLGFQHKFISDSIDCILKVTSWISRWKFLEEEWQELYKIFAQPLSHDCLLKIHVWSRWSLNSPLGIILNPIVLL